MTDADLDEILKSLDHEYAELIREVWRQETLAREMGDRIAQDCFEYYAAAEEMKRVIGIDLPVVRPGVN
jgi:hypothetical protein